MHIKLPILNSIERILICDIVHKKEAHRSSIISRRDGPVSFLAGGILENMS